MAAAHLGSRESPGAIDQVAVEGNQVAIVHLEEAGNPEAAGLAAVVESQEVVGSLVVDRAGTVVLDHLPRRVVEGGVGRLPRVLRVD
jgi:hypothetical protein